jgi:acyl-coenzyme A thioesterase 13
MGDASLHDRALVALDVPLLKFLGAEFVGWSNDRARVLLDVGPNALNGNDKLHGGVICTLLDVTAYLALLPTLEPPETAVTHDMNTAFFSAASLNDEMCFEAQIIHRGKTVAFVESAARVGNKRIALATVCKSLLVLR